MSALPQSTTNRDVAQPSSVVSQAQGKELGIRRMSIQCPHCSVELHVPFGLSAAKVRCSLCRQGFVIGAHGASEDQVASWLTNEGAGGGRAKPRPAVAAAPSAVVPLSNVPKARQRPLPMPHNNRDIRVVTLETHGVLLEFPARMLESPDFRCSMPRRCVQCGMRTHLRAHVIIFADQLADSIIKEREHASGPLQLNNSEIQTLTGRQVLDRLQPVPNVPPPADLPMPYWICDMCSGSGMISGQIQVNPQTHSGFCRLRIGSVFRAMEFMRNCGAEGTADFQRLRELVDKTGEKPWDMLPEEVQHRLQQWFQPEPSEQFLAYVPDRDHMRTEDGMAGLLVSTKRLIFHTPMRHRESPVSEPVELEHSLALLERKEAVNVRTPAWSLKHLAVDRDGLTHLRRALTVGGYKAVWR